MLRFKKLFSLSSNVATGGFPKRFTSIPTIPSSSVLMINALKNRGTISRCYSRRKPPGDNRPERLVPLKFETFEEEIDETKSSNPILILHGLLGSKDHWCSMAKQLNKITGRKVYTVDSRNHGESPHTTQFHYEFLACDLILFMRTNKIPRATIIGHNLGGRIGMMVAMRYPDLVRSLIVADIFPIGESPNMLGMQKMLRDIKNLLLDRHYTIKEARKQAAAQLKEKKYDDRMIFFLLTNLVPNEFNTNWRWKFNLDSIIKNLEKEVVCFPIVHAPCYTRTLFLGGGNSDLIDVDDEAVIKTVFPRAEFRHIKKAGHWLHADKPAEFLDIVTEFVENDPTKLQEEVEKYPTGKPVELKYRLFSEYIDSRKSNIPVLILHGLLDCKLNWHMMAMILNQKLARPIYTVDARNHGESPHAELFNYELMAADVFSLLYKLNIKKVSLIGHNMGGRTAMMMAMIYPVAVQSLIVVNISPLGATPGMSAIKKVMQDVKNLDLDPQLSLGEARKEAYSQLKQTVEDENIITALLANMTENSGKSNWRWTLNLDSICKYFEKEMVNFNIMRAPLPIRTLFIGGTNSDYLKPEDEDEIKTLLPIAKFSYIQEAGHWVHVDDPIQFANLVKGFVDTDPKLPKEEDLPLMSVPVELNFQKYDDHTDKSKPDIPIIILHGLLGSKQNWNSMAAKLNKKLGRTVYALDARNHGESPHTKVFTYHLMMLDVFEFIHNNRIERATLIGHSMGGRTAMTLAMEVPHIIEKLVVVDISPLGVSPNMLGIEGLLQDIEDLDLNPQLTYGEARKEAAIQLIRRIRDDKLIAFLLTNIVENKEKTDKIEDSAKANWSWRFNVNSIRQNFRNELVQFRILKTPVPVCTLFVAGSKSDYLKPEEEADIKRVFPRSTFKYVEGAGHWVHAEKPIDFFNIVSAFIENGDQ